MAVAFHAATADDSIAWDNIAFVVVIERFFRLWRDSLGLVLQPLRALSSLMPISSCCGQS